MTGRCGRVPAVGPGPGGLVVTSVLLVALSAACARAPIVQPIAFNHALHVEEGMDCDDCHQYYAKAEFSGLPRIEICMECHEDPMTDSVQEELIVQHAARNEEIPWRRVYQLPDHVYYSHRRHVITAGVACVTCHGDVGALTAPPSRPLVRQDMDWCIDCHEKEQASTDCLHCHR